MRQISTILILTWLFSLSISSPCSKHYSESSLEFIIPESESCQLQEEDTSVFGEITWKQIIIYGELRIEDNVSIRVKFLQLALGNSGSIIIGNEAPIRKHKIIFENLSPTQCDTLVERSGKIKVNSTPFRLFELAKSNMSGQTLLDFPKNIDEIQNEMIQIVGFDKKDTYFAHSKIIMPDPPFYSNNESVSDYHYIDNGGHFKTPNYFFASSNRSYGVSFEKFCLTAEVAEIIGVAFLNTKGISVGGNYIMYSIFDKNYGYDSLFFQIPLNYTFNLNFLQNIVTRGEVNLHVEDNNQVDLNLILDINIPQISQNFFQTQNTLKQALIKIKCHEGQEELSFSKVQIFQSELSISFGSPSSLKIQDGCLFYEVSFFPLLKEYYSIEIRDSVLIKIELNVMLRRISSVYIKNTKIYGANYLNHFIAMQQFPFPQSDDIVEIFLVQSEIAGFKKAVFSNDPYFLTRRSLTGGVVQIELKSFLFTPTFDESGKSSTLFEFSNSLVTLFDHKNEKKYIIEVDQAFHQTLFKKSNYILDGNSYGVRIYESPDLPSIIKVSIKALPEYLLKSTVNQKQGFQIINTPLQIFPGVPQLLSLQLFSSQYSPLENLSSLFVELFNSVSSVNNPREKEKRLYLVGEVPIFKITVSIIKENTDCVELSNSLKQLHSSCDIESKYELSRSEYEYDQDQSRIFFNQYQNSIVISWTKLERSNMLYYFEIEYCHSKQFISTEFGEYICVDQCTVKQNQYQLCHSQCESIIKDQIEQDYCQECSAGCISCGNPPDRQCHQCENSFVLFNGNCLSECPKGFYAYEKKCRQCLQGCLKCSNDSYCDVCEEPRDDIECISIDPDHISKQCYLQGCYKCIGHGIFSCDQCSEFYYMINGMCQKQF